MPISRRVASTRGKLAGALRARQRNDPRSLLDLPRFVGLTQVSEHAGDYTSPGEE